MLQSHAQNVSSATISAPFGRATFIRLGKWTLYTTAPRLWLTSALQTVQIDSAGSQLGLENENGL